MKIQQIHLIPIFQLKTIAGGNCTNFVSTCIYMGQLKQTSKYINEIDYQLNKKLMERWCYCVIEDKYRASLTWCNADDFARHWGYNLHDEGQQRGYMSIYISSLKNAYNNLGFIACLVKRGDIIQLARNSDKEIHHSMIILSTNHSNKSIKYAQHTGNKIDYFNEYLSSYKDDTPESFILHILKNGD